jgi:hypothetical protein
MDGHRNQVRQWRWKGLGAIASDAYGRAEDRARSGCTKGDDRSRPELLNLVLEPIPAGQNLVLSWPLVYAALAARGPFEVLDRVRQVNLFDSEAGLAEALTEQLAGGPDERLTCEIFAVAGLFAYQHHLC